MFGLLMIVVGILLVKAMDNDMGWIAFWGGGAIACWGGISLASSGAKEIGN
jgi:hypothetical protein